MPRLRNATVSLHTVHGNLFVTFYAHCSIFDRTKVGYKHHALDTFLNHFYVHSITKSVILLRVT